MSPNFKWIIGILLAITAGTFLTVYIATKTATLWQPNSTANPLPTPLPTSTTPRPSSTGQFIGIMGVFPDDLPTIKSWGGNTVEYHGPTTSSSDVQSFLSFAKANYLNVFIVGPGKERIHNGRLGVDLAKVKSETQRYLGTDGAIGADPAFLGFWILDEPCHANKWELTATDLKNVYSTIKQVNSGIPVLINFGSLECFQDIIATAQPGWKLTDVAMFTVTSKKTQDSPRRGRGDYLASQAAISKDIKVFDPTIKVVPNIAVLEFLDQNLAIPTPDWITLVSNSVISHPEFDGLMFNSYRKVAPWMGQTIIDVQSDPDYYSAISSAFSSACR